MRARLTTPDCADYSQAGVELFVYGDDLSNKAAGPKKYPARQTLPASQAIARSHGLNPDKVVFARQNPDAIDQGVFHNDVIAVGNQDLLFHHRWHLQIPSRSTPPTRRWIRIAGHWVPADAVSLEDAVRSYLFNSQLLTVPGQQGRSSVVPVEEQKCHQYKNI